MITERKFQVTSGKWQVKPFAALLVLSLVTCHFSPAAFAAFRDQGWGTRAAGMGGAFTAISDDSSATMYNPAGLGRLSAPELSVMYAKPFAGLDLKAGTDGSTSLGMNYAAVAAPLGRWGSAAASWANFNATRLYEENTYAVGYAKGLHDFWPDSDFKLFAGVSAKSLGTKFTLDDLTRAAEATSTRSPFRSGTSQSALSLDAGLLLNPMSSLWIGLSGRNLNSPDVGLAQQDRVPRDVRLAAAWTAAKTGPFEDATATIEFSRRAPKGQLAETRALLGVESWFHSHAYALRTGGNDRELSFGGSLNRSFQRMAVQLDYAFVLSTTLDENSGTHRVSLTIRGGGAPARTAYIPPQKVLARGGARRGDVAPFGADARRVEIFDMQGKRLWSAQTSENGAIRWPGTDSRGRVVPNDAYIFKAENTRTHQPDYGVVVLEK